MAIQVVKVAGIFTGAETGRSCVDTLTTQQLDALIEHQWPVKQVDDGADPLALVIENIKKQPNGSAFDKTQVKVTKTKNIDYSSLVNSRMARLKSVLAIGKKLRKDGIYFSEYATKSLITIYFVCIKGIMPIPPQLWLSEDNEAPEISHATVIADLGYSVHGAGSGDKQMEGLQVSQNRGIWVFISVRKILSNSYFQISLIAITSSVGKRRKLQSGELDSFFWHITWSFGVAYKRFYITMFVFCQ